MIHAVAIAVMATAIAIMHKKTDTFLMASYYSIRSSQHGGSPVTHSVSVSKLSKVYIINEFMPRTLLFFTSSAVETIKYSSTISGKRTSGISRIVGHRIRADVVSGLHGQMPVIAVLHRNDYQRVSMVVRCCENSFIGSTVEQWVSQHASTDRQATGFDLHHTPSSDNNYIFLVDCKLVWA
jgi:hypothetical protein